MSLKTERSSVAKWSASLSSNNSLDIQWRREERETRERVGERHRNKGKKPGGSDRKVCKNRQK